jgi:hypothetical protein
LFGTPRSHLLDSTTMGRGENWFNCFSAIEQLPLYAVAM